MSNWLISTHAGLWQAVEDGRCEPWALGYYYGIALLPDAVLVARRAQSLSKTSPTYLEAYSYDGLRLAEPEIDAYDLRDIHQIAADSDGIWLTDGARSLAYHLPSNTIVDPGSGSLLNSVWPAGDGSIWFVLHNRGERASEILRSNMAGHIVERRELEHHGVHNVLFLDNYLCYNASDDGEVVIGPQTVALGDRWHPKGMAQTEDGRLVVGVSEREVSLEERFTSESWLAVIKGGEVIERIPLRTADGGHIGNVNEIVRLPEADSG